MIIANGEDFHILHRIMGGAPHGTLFKGNKNPAFSLSEMLAGDLH